MARLALTLTACLATAGTLAAAPSVAAGEAGAPGEAGTPSGSSAPACPAANPPNTLQLLAGTPVKLTAGVGAIQSARIGGRFPIQLAVTVTDAEKSPVPGALVTFTAPARGPSGRFTMRTHSSRRYSSHIRRLRSVTITTDACGIAVAPPFTANRRPGGYIVTAAVAHVRPAAFALVNAGPGQQP
jgi:hypothetical protein